MPSGPLLHPKRTELANMPSQRPQASWLLQSNTLPNHHSTISQQVRLSLCITVPLVVTAARRSWAVHGGGAPQARSPAAQLPGWRVHRHGRPAPGAPLGAAAPGSQSAHACAPPRPARSPHRLQNAAGTKANEREAEGTACWVGQGDKTPI